MRCSGAEFCLGRTASNPSIGSVAGPSCRVALFLASPRTGMANRNCSIGTFRRLPAVDLRVLSGLAFLPG